MGGEVVGRWVGWWSVVHVKDVGWNGVVRVEDIGWLSARDVEWLCVVGGDVGRLDVVGVKVVEG